jgi:putative ABC transport system permease protein
MTAGGAGALDLLRYAAGGLRGHRLRTSLSLLGVAIGVASVILITSLGEGARLYITGEFASLGSNLLIIIPGKTETVGHAPLISTAPHDLTVADVEALERRVPQIRRAAPVSLGAAPIRYGERRREVTVFGTTHAIQEIRKIEMGIGRFLPEGELDAPICVIGSKIQSELFGSENPLGKMVRVGETRCRVIGVLAPRGTSIGVDLDEVVDIPVETGLRMFNRTSLFRVLAEVRSPEDLDSATGAVLAVLKERHGGEEDVTVLTQDAVISTFDTVLRVLTAALSVIAAISLTVAGIGIMNVMLVSVSERTREIGLLKAVGVTRSQVLGVFLLEASVISTAGGLLGVGGGLAAGRFVHHLYPDLPVHPPLWAIAMALAVSVSVGVLFGALPARNATRLDPVEALMRRRA